MYQVLYRKWRPRTFAEVSGQDAVTTALRNEIKTGRVSHAYLFVGSRGTGKTSCARILAKAVNCLSPDGGEPCNRCDICRGIDDGSVPDVVEIDAASHSGVDTIRELREEAYYSPAVAARRVYIIDEFHMLSDSAFNALLKILEEPPSHVIFILATTERRKLLATIVSRCQRFDFNRISSGDLAARLAYIAGQESIELDGEAAALLARMADGSARDAINLLDQCVSYGNTVTVETAAAACGLAGSAHIRALTDAVAAGDAAAGLRLLDRLHSASVDFEALCHEWLRRYRDLMLLRTVPDPGDMITATADDREGLQRQADAFTLPQILEGMQTLQNAIERMRFGVSRRIETEMALIRLCAAPASANVAVSASKAVASGKSAPASANVAVSASKAAAPGKSAPAPTADEVPFAQWEEVLRRLSETCVPLFGVLDGSGAVVRGDFVLIQTDSPLFRHMLGQDSNKSMLAAAIREVSGRNYRIGMKKSAAPAAAGPLDEFLRASREMGAAVTEE